MTTIIIIFVILSVFYYFISVPLNASPQIFLTIATFLFATFTGFFVARQGRRYSEIRNQISSFDGEMSSIFRQFGHLSKNAQKEVQQIIRKHYTTILSSKAWDYHIIHKSSTITNIHLLTERIGGTKPFPSLKHLALQRILTALETLQVLRKKMVALHTERIPKFQWFIIYFLALLLLLAITLIPSQFIFYSALMKGAFGSSVISVIVMLHRFNSLKFFEAIMGEQSAQDILDIFSGKK